MTERRRDIDWEKTTFDGSRREQLRRWRAMSLRQRLEALDQLSDLAARMQTIPRREGSNTSDTIATGVHDQGGSYRADMAIHSLFLEGCTPIPLASYLKALGILRLVAEQTDPNATGYWKNDIFVLQTALDRDALRAFFLKQYRPTPILSPWNGRAGFLEGEEDSNRKGALVLRRVTESKGLRFAAYRDVIDAAVRTPAISGLNRVRSEAKRLEKAKKENKGFDNESAEKLKLLKKQERTLKDSVLTSLRSNLSDEFLGWIDACVVVTEEATTAPLLGSGGNEGSMDFSINHAHTLCSLFDANSDSPTVVGAEQIENALFGLPSQSQSLIKRKTNPGFLSPGVLGGPNMASGFSGTLMENPWNAVLALEGAILFASVATKRLGSESSSSASFPFTFNPTRAGNGSVSSTESTRAEFWAPLWAAPVSLPELASMLSEARITLNGKHAVDGFGVSRAIAKLGVDRGIMEFVRFGFYERRGQGYYVAAPLERIPVRRNTKVDLIDELDRNRWLYKFQRLARQTKPPAPARLQHLARKLEDALFDLSRFPDPRYVQRVLIALGQAQDYLATSPTARQSCPPVPCLSAAWSTAANDGSAVFRVAAALAGLHLQTDEHDQRPAMPMVMHFAPVDPHGRGAWPKDPAVHAMVWHSGDLSRNLYAVMQRRMLDALRNGTAGKPLAHFATAPLAHVAEWLASPAMDTQVDALLHGLVLARIPRGFAGKMPAPLPLPAAFATLKPLFCTEQQLRRCGLLATDAQLPLEPEILRRIWRGGDDAMEHATRRLRTAGLQIDTTHIDIAGINSQRLLAALSIPIADHDLKRLLNPLRPSTRNDGTEAATA